MRYDGRKRQPLIYNSLQSSIIVSLTFKIDCMGRYLNSKRETKLQRASTNILHQRHSIDKFSKGACGQAILILYALHNKQQNSILIM